jgi:trans-2,3-dihydro-3-hydroxyanthranilate isomerase
MLPSLGDWHNGETVRSYVVCDVFAARPLEGNQLAVFLDGDGLTGEQMQALALEMSLAETVFILPPQKSGDVALRIFTPRTELPFAGHPVLGTSFVVGRALGKDSLLCSRRGVAISTSFSSVTKAKLSSGG